MSFVSEFIAGRQARKLRSARSLSPVALARIQEALAGLGSVAIAPLTECLGHAEARPAAIDILGRLLSEATLDEFLHALDCPNPAITSGLGRVLSSSRNYDPSRLLPLLLQKGVSRGVLEGILTEQLGRIPAERLVACVNSAPRDAQTILFRLLEKLPPGGAARLSDLLKHEDPWVRMNATRLLGQGRDASAGIAISRLLRDAHKGVRLEAVQALTALNARAAVPELVPVLRDGDLKIQTAAIDALVALADASAVPLLLAVLTDEADTVRRAAVEVLNAVATTEAVQDLVRALRDQDWWVRVRAADALGTLGGETVVQAAAGLLQDGDDSIRRHAVEILNAVPGHGAVAALAGALEDPDWWVRERAIDALGKSRDARAVAPLLAQLSRGGSSVALPIRALGALGHADALAPLIDLLQSEREEVRQEARQALRALAHEPLSPKERRSLVEALGPGQAPACNDASIPMRAQSRSPRPSSGFASAPAERPAPAAAAQPAPRALNFAELPPETVLLDRYRVLRKVGRGGFGAVYLVEDSMIHEDVILKILNPQLSVDESAARRFVQELKLTRRITHPNVIRIYDFLNLDGAHAVSMEYFQGRDLGQVLAAEKTLDFRRGLQILAQVCEGLEAAHAVGVVHRDIKPANILVGGTGAVKVVDFGLASLQQQLGSRLTRSGILIGTPEYMAPEQITGEAVDARADIYSAGIVLYEMFSGCKPYVAETPVKILFQHLEGKAEPLGQRVAGLPAGIGELVASAMARSPAERPPGAAALRARIEEELRALEAAA